MCIVAQTAKFVTKKNRTDPANVAAPTCHTERRSWMSCPIAVVARMQA